MIAIDLKPEDTASIIAAQSAIANAEQTLSSARSTFEHTKQAIVTEYTTANPQKHNSVAKLSDDFKHLILQ